MALAAEKLHFCPTVGVQTDLNTYDALGDCNAANTLRILNAAGQTRFLNADPADPAPGSGLVKARSSKLRTTIRKVATSDISLGSTTLTFNPTAKTITRSAGSWLTDGVAAGDDVLLAGFAQSGNNNYFHVWTATALTLTLADAKAAVAETNRANCTYGIYQVKAIASTAQTTDTPFNAYRLAQLNLLQNCRNSIYVG